jgi:hypothetical protein
MENEQALTVPQPMALMVLPESHVQRIGGLILRLIDRSGRPQVRGLSFSRIVVVCEQLAIYYLPISYSTLFGLNLDRILAIDDQPIPARLIGGRAGCALVVDISVSYRLSQNHSEEN